MGPPETIFATAPQRGGASARIKSWWWDLPLRGKALLIILVPTLTMMIPATYALQLNRDQAEVRHQARSSRVDQDLVVHLASDVATANSGVLNYSSTGDQQALVSVGALTDGYPGRIADIKAGAPSELEAPIEELDRATSELIDHLTVTQEQAVSSTDTTLPALSMDRVQEQAALVASVDKAVDEVIADFDQLNAAYREHIDSISNKVVLVLTVGIVASLVTGLVALLLFVRSIVKRVQVVTASATRVIDGGSLGEIEAPAGDELGQLAAELIRAAEMLLMINQEITASRDTAVAATVAKDVFLSRMSHELRTPLTAILGFGQLLQMEESLSADDAEAVGQIVKAGRHLLDLINDLLDISRIATGHLALSLESVHVVDAVDAVIGLMRPQARDKDITITSYVAPEITVTADHQRLKQVLLNFVSNAIKYNAVSGTVEIRAQVTGDHVRVSVIDSGPGISEEGRRRLFMPFERLDATSTIEGTGVGLALSKSLIESMEGTIGVDSAVRRGSTFWIELPGQIEYPMKPRVEIPAATRIFQPASFASTVLYVEDNLANVRVMERLMRGRSEHLEIAMQGGLAISLAREIKPQVILLDLHLPDMHGSEVLTTLHSDPATASIPIVVLSADTTEGGVRRLLDLGAAAYLTKPIDMAELTQLLDDLPIRPVAS